MLRIAAVFLVALVLGAAGGGVLISRLVPLPVPTPTEAVTSPGDPDAPAVAAAPAAAAAVRDPMQHLPAWVQTRRPAMLWSGADRDAQAFSQLPTWTFLQVDGVEGGRLHVEYTGDGQTRQPGPGWVDLDAVQPSDPSGSWLRNHRPSQVFADPRTSTSSTPVAQWSTMVTLEPPSAGGSSASAAGSSPAPGRLHVRVYSPEFLKVAVEGWIAAADVGPVGPPQVPVSTAPTSAPAARFTSHADFLAVVGAAAVATRTASGVPASVTVAQAILESDWGNSLLTRQANNYFGIKATGSIGNDGAVWMKTLEVANGGTYTVTAPFRAYKTLADSVADHANLLLNSPRYAAALQAKDDPNEFARRIAAAGYSTDPNYAAKLVDLMQRFDLYRFDRLPAPAAPLPASPSA